MSKKKQSVFLVLLLLMLFLSGNFVDVKAETSVSGPVSGFWTTSGSPYLVTGSIVVPIGETLHIMPGVEILFAAERSLSVYGTLLATGAPGDSIIFARETENSWGGINFISAHENCVIQYCVITDALASGNDQLTGCGGGIYCENSSPSILFNRISNCVASSASYTDKGGGIACFGGAPVIEGNYIANCSQTTIFGGGGGIYCESSNPVISNNLIRNCTAVSYGGGIYGINSTVMISHNVITECSVNNGGGGVDLEYNCSGDLFNNLICNNFSRDLNGGVMIFACNINIHSCSIVNNSTQGADMFSGVGALSSTLTMTNSIIWNNINETTPSTPQLGPSDLSNISYCDIEGGFPGTANINSNPLFVGHSGGLFFLSQIDAGQGADSPCLNTGLGLAVNEGLDIFSTRTDYVGDTGTVDIGFHYYPPNAADVALDEPLLDLRFRASPNPFEIQTMIQLSSPNSNVDQLQIYDASGRFIRTLLPEIDSNQIRFTWSGLDENDQRVSRGVYFIRFNSDTPVSGNSGKIILLR